MRAALQPLSLVLLAPNILIVKADSPFKTVGDRSPGRRRSRASSIRLGRRRHGAAPGGRAVPPAAPPEMVHVPYKSGGPAISDVMAGQVDFMFSTVAASYPLIAGGKLRALAVSAPVRSKRLPDVPTVAEAAIPGYEAYEWNGIFLPAGTPPPSPVPCTRPWWTRWRTKTSSAARPTGSAAGGLLARRLCRLPEEGRQQVGNGRAPWQYPSGLSHRGAGPCDSCNSCAPRDSEIPRFRDS